MNVVRICFQASYRDPQGQMRRMDPVLSEPVYDKSESRMLCPLGLSLAAGTKKPHIQWPEQTGACFLPLFLSFLLSFFLSLSLSFFLSLSLSLSLSFFLSSFFSLSSFPFLFSHVLCSISTLVQQL